MSSSDAAGSEALTGRRDVASPTAAPTDGDRGARIPEGTCRLCWHDHLVWRDGVWMLAHRGSFDACTHACHDTGTLLPSTS